MIRGDDQRPSRRDALGADDLDAPIEQIQQQPGQAADDPINGGGITTAPAVLRRLDLGAQRIFRVPFTTGTSASITKRIWGRSVSHVVMLAAIDAKGASVLAFHTAVL